MNSTIEAASSATVNSSAEKTPFQARRDNIGHFTLAGKHHPLSPSSFMGVPSASTRAREGVPSASTKPAQSVISAVPPEVVRSAPEQPYQRLAKPLSELTCTTLESDPAEDGLPLWADEVAVECPNRRGRLVGIAGSYVAQGAMKYVRTACGRERFDIVRSENSRKWKIRWLHNRLPRDREKTIYISIEIGAATPVGLQWRCQGSRRIARNVRVRGFAERAARGIMWTLGTRGGTQRYACATLQAVDPVVAIVSSIARPDEMSATDMVSGHCATTAYTAYTSGLGCVTLDFGWRRRVQVESYALRHGFSTGHARAVEWVLEGQSDADAAWVLLHSHTAGDRTQLPQCGFASALWRVSPTRGRGVFQAKHWMRSVRLRMMAPNMNNRPSLVLCGIEIYGALRDDALGAHSPSEPDALTFRSRLSGVTGGGGPAWGRRTSITSDNPLNALSNLS